MKVLLMVNQT
ncbi:unnamed protein product, partial [Onchocerca ochengi]|uniref:Uncharacterized protein n=1 Tax=Onchocerca ochengi TaxID=42157 RepID=A0A182EPV2_ONCOC